MTNTALPLLNPTHWESCGTIPPSATMSFSYRLRVGGYSLNTRIRLQSFKVRAPKETPDTATAFSATEKDSLLSATSKIKSEDIVREGAVRVKEYGVHPRSWFFKIKWLVLYEEQLALHASQTKAPRSSISLANIEKLERTNRVPCGLTLQTKNGRRYLLSFEKDSDLYDWQDEICRRSMGVGLPHNFVHKTHCSFDPISGAFTGLPAGWVNAHYQNINLGENVVPENAEPVTSLVITRRGATSQVQYVWRVVS
ncbi:hypothetical protein K438DRAFT_734074 [Mycena galopus ATCC 62051]|nr:hypothetical protein K438DRAFT_734074 [Mycena galopus ATCC 62051]